MNAYTWSRAQEALSQAVGLDPDPFDDTLLEYQNPLTGGPALPTIGTAIQTLRPGANANRIVAQSILAESELLGAILFPTSGQTWH
jgi:gentisate 1,2-dioxygenase